MPRLEVPNDFTRLRPHDAAGCGVVRCANMLFNPGSFRRSRLEAINNLECRRPVLYAMRDAL